MYILVDKETMRVLAKYHSVTGISSLAWLQYPDKHISISSCIAAVAFEYFTDLELKLLYQNTCEGVPAGIFYSWSRDGLLALLKNTIDRLPEFDANEYELNIQADSVKEPGEIYRYVKGSMKPELAEDLFERPALTISRDELIEQESKTSIIVRNCDWFEPREPQPVQLKISKVFNYAEAIPLPIKQPWL